MRAPPANDQFASPTARRIERVRQTLAEARHEYDQNRSAIEDALRASPDFAPAFAEPGEMERREREEAGETGHWPIVVGIAIGLLAALPVLAVLAVLVVTWMRGGL